MKNNFPLKSYPEYKESGVQWLGKVPGHWEVKKIKQLFRCIGGGTPSKGNASFWEGDIPWVSPKDMHERTILDTEDHISENALVESATQMVPAGATLVVVRSGILRHTLPVATNLVPVALNQDMKALVSNGAIKNVYLTYYIQGHNKSLLDVWTKNSCTVESVESAYMLGALMTVPPIPEQTAIADFLDRETGQIDTLVVKKRRLVELLKEQRTALISRTVTRGLPEAAAREFGLEPHTRSKDSGIEWLGEVPEGWTVKKVCYLTTFKGGSTPSTSEARFWDNGDTPWVSPKDMKSRRIINTQDHLTPEGVAQCASGLVAPGHVMIVVRSGILRHTLPVAINDVPVALNQDMRAFKLKGDMVPDYLSWLIHGNQKALLEQWCKSGTTVESIETEYLTGSHLPAPPIPEQTAITTYLDRETAKIDQLVEKIEAAIARLQEYRTALITAAVTGKIDVREPVTEKEVA